MNGYYVASRASIPARAIMWQVLRAQGMPIVSTWIDEAGEGDTADFTELWTRIEREIRSSKGLIVYAEREDFPLKGALVEPGMALAMGKPVAVLFLEKNGEPMQLEGRTLRPVGSWIMHPNCARVNSLDEATRYIDMFSKQNSNDNRTDRAARQQRVLDWTLKMLPETEVNGEEQRAIRLAEETIELAQACNVDKALLHRLVDYVYNRPVGEKSQELGGVGVCVLAIANALGLDADVIEELEVRRCEAMDPEKFKARNAAKNAAGFEAKP